MLTTLILVVICLTMALALWHCYKTNKPLREEARKKAEEKAKQEREVMQRQLEEAGKQSTRENTFADLDWAIRDPERHFPCGYRLNGDKRFKFPELAKVLHNAKQMDSVIVDTRNLSERVHKQSSLIHDQRAQIKALQANIEDIKKALQMGVPVEL